MSNEIMEEGVELKVISPDVIYQQDKAIVDMQVATAKQFPRSIKKAVENAITTVTMDVETANSCTYSVPRGGKSVTGPSVHLSKILLQYWGNMRVETKVIGIDAKHVTSQAIAFDLETNVAIKVEVKRSVLTKSGRMNDDMITVTGNAANAIAMRNAIYAVIPKAVVTKVYNEAKKAITGDVSDQTKLINRRKQVFDGFRETYGVNEQEILNAIGRAAIDHVSPDDIVTIIGIGQAIKDGDTTVELAFRTIRDSANSDEYNQCASDMAKINSKETMLQFETEYAAILKKDFRLLGKFNEYKKLWRNK
jgi:hypothetical protein